MKQQLLAFLLSCWLTAEVATAIEMYFKYKTKFNGEISLSYGFTQKVGLLANEKQSILDMTNAARHKITTGQEKNTPAGLAPNATNMMAVEWDDNLAAFAQNWADQCASGHSPPPRKIKNYETAMIAENLSGPTLRVYKNMYGEIRGWTYVTQTCNAQCGHYNTLVSWSNFRMGCGFKLCESKTGSGVPTMEPSLVCEFAPYRAAGLMVSSKRLKWQYEYWTNLKPGVSYTPDQPASVMYAKTVPCSDCPQGWDYCMKGGLCATKHQCDSDAGNNDCVCNTDQADCEKNGGTFDSDKCQCKCPANRYGRNCAHECQNTPGVWRCGMECNNTVVEDFLCYESCGSCGQSVGKAYKVWVEQHPPTDADRLKIRATPPMPRPAISKDVKTADLPDRGTCKNRESDYFCENIRARNYCNDGVTGAKWKYYCAGSCNSCDNKEWVNKLKKAMKDAGGTFVPAASVTTTNTGWAPAPGSGGGGGGWAPSPGSGGGGGGWTPTGGSSVGAGGWAPTGGSGGGGGGWSPSGGSGGGGGGWSPSGGSGGNQFKNALSDTGWVTAADAKEPAKSSGGSGGNWEDVGSVNDGWKDVGPGANNGWTT